MPSNAIALDAMTAEGGIEVVVEGAMSALANPAFASDIILVGNQDDVEAIVSYLNRNAKYDHSRLSMLHADSVIRMDQDPSITREKKGCSVMVAADLVRKDQAYMMISAGNTGATAVAAVINLGRLKVGDQSRISCAPPIAGMMPTEQDDKHVVVLDLGISKHCKTEHYIEMAILGAEYHRHTLPQNRRIKVGLLNTGSEPYKGTDEIKEALSLLKAYAQSTKWIEMDNAEPRAISKGEFDVVVADGYSGNVFLKTAEAYVKMVGNIALSHINSSWLAKLGGLLIKSSGVDKLLRKRLSDRAYGGALQLGLNRGAAMVCHGGVDGQGIESALLRADYVREKLESLRENSRRRLDYYSKLRDGAAVER